MGGLVLLVLGEQVEVFVDGEQVLVLLGLLLLLEPGDPEVGVLVQRVDQPVLARYVLVSSVVVY